METTPLTILLIVSAGIVSMMAFSRPELLGRLLLDARAVETRGEYWRLVTSGWVHANFTHLLVNMFSFYSFGRVIEYVLGPGMLALVYLGGIVGGSVLALVLHRGQNYRALGASGGVCAVIFASVLLTPGSSLFIIPIPIPIPAQLYAFGFLGWTWWGMRRHGADGIGHDAHFAGAIVGVAIILVSEPRIVAATPFFVLGLFVVCGWMLWQSLAEAARGRNRDWQ